MGRHVLISYIDKNVTSQSYMTDLLEIYNG